MTARKEIILSGGTVGTPHILLNSGIGDAKALKAVGVKPIVNLPDVGKNMVDHSLIANPFLVKSVCTLLFLRGGLVANRFSENNTFEPFLRDPAVQAEQIGQWISEGQGPMVNTIASQLAFFRLPKSDPIFKTISDPSSGPNTPHYEFLISVCSTPTL